MSIHEMIKPVPPQRGRIAAWPTVLLMVLLVPQGACSKDSASEQNTPAATTTSQQGKDKTKPKRRDRAKRAGAKKTTSGETASPTKPPVRSTKKTTTDLRKKGAVGPPSRGTKKSAPTATRKTTHLNRVAPPQLRQFNKPPPPPADRPLDISPLINREKIAVLLAAKKGFLPKSLSGQVPEPGYNHTRMVPRGSSRGALGLVAQIWKDERIPDARQRFDAFLSSYPEAKRNSTITRKTFFARYGDRRYVGFLETSKKITVVLTCDDTTCTSEQLLSIAKIIRKSLLRLKN